MKCNQFAVYQVKGGEQYRDLRFCPFEELSQRNITVDVASYDQAYISHMSPSDTPESIRARFEKQLPKSFKGHAISVSDVFVFNRDGNVTSYYVDKDKLIDLPGFLPINPTDSFITMDTAGYKIEGKTGTWVACEEESVEGRQFYLMQNETYGSNAAFVVLSEDGKVAVDSSEGFDDETLGKIKTFLHPPEHDQTVSGKPPLENWQKYNENGEYLRSAELTNEQNYDMVDGRINNLPKPRMIGNRESALDKLHIKQAEIAIRSGKPIPKSLENLTEERDRK